MTEQEREELIEKMVAALINSRLMGFNSENTARAALAVAEPVIREQEDNALREENARLREALKPFAKNEYLCLGRNNLDYYYVLISHIRAAAAAIREGGKDEN